MKEICNCDYYLSANSKRAHEPNCEFVDYELGQAEAMECICRDGLCKSWGTCDRQCTFCNPNQPEAEERCHCHCRDCGRNADIKHIFKNCPHCSPLPREERDWEEKLNELGFNHPPLHKFIRNLLKNSSLRICEDKWCEQNNLEGYKHYQQNPKCMYFKQALDEMEEKK